MFWAKSVQKSAPTPSLILANVEGLQRILQASRHGKGRKGKLEKKNEIKGGLRHLLDTLNARR